MTTPLSGKADVTPNITELGAFGDLAGALWPNPNKTQHEGGHRITLSNRRLIGHAQFFCTREMFEMLFGGREFGPEQRRVTFAQLSQAVSEATDGSSRSDAERNSDFSSGCRCVTAHAVAIAW